MSTPAQAPQTAPKPQMPPAAVPMPYVPTAEEESYLLECAAAIVGGCKSATEAAAAGDAAKYLDFANGVKSLTAAYVEIKTGGKAATGHQGS